MSLEILRKQEQDLIALINIHSQSNDPTAKLMVAKFEKDLADTQNKIKEVM